MGRAHWPAAQRPRRGRRPAGHRGPWLPGPGRGVHAPGSAALGGPHHRRGRAVAARPGAFLRRRAAPALRAGGPGGRHRERAAPGGARPPRVGAGGAARRCQAGGEAKDEAELAGVLSEQLRHAANMDSCHIWRWDQQSGDLVPVGASGRTLEASARDLAIDRVARHVLITDEPLRLDGRNGRLDPAGQARLAELGGGSALLVPLSTGGRVVGLAELAVRSGDHHFHAGEIAWLRTMASQAAGALENASLVRQLRDAAETDPVTGVYSHRHLQDRIRQETARAARSGSPLSVLMVDLDDFKHVNDAFGHQAGDRVLRAIAGSAPPCARATWSRATVATSSWC